MKTHRRLVLGLVFCGLFMAPAVQAAGKAADHASFKHNSFYIFGTAFLASAIAAKLFGMGLESTREIAKSAEKSLDQKLEIKKKKSDEAKDVLKNIAEKGLYTGLCLIAAAIIKQQLKMRCGFSLTDSILCAH